MEEEMVRSPARARWGAWARAARPLGRESGVWPGREGMTGVGALARLREEARVRERDGVRNRGTGAAVQPPCRGRRAGRAPGRAAASLPPSRRQGRRTCTAAGSRRSPRVLPRLRGPASVPVTLARCGSTWSGPARHPPPPRRPSPGPRPPAPALSPAVGAAPPAAVDAALSCPLYPPPLPVRPRRRVPLPTTGRGDLAPRETAGPGWVGRGGRGQGREGQGGRGQGREAAVRWAGGARHDLGGGGEGGRLRQSRSRRWGTGRQKGADHPLRRRRRRRRRRRQAMRVAVGGVVAQRRARHAGRDCLALA